MENLFKSIFEISNNQELKDITQLALKGTEEMGELAQAILSYTNAPGSEFRTLGLDDVKQEIVDVILVMGSLACKIGMSIDEIKEIAEIKKQKWINKMIKANNYNKI